METTQQGPTALTWESWECPRCGSSNRCRAYCASCRMELGAAEAETARATAAVPVEPCEAAAPAEATAPAPLPRASRGPRWIVFAVVVGVLAVATAGGGAYLAGRDKPYPKAWDPKVAELARFVERERGLAFDHPVVVDFLTPKEYRGSVTTEESGLSAQDKQEIRQFAGLMRALGLLTGKADLLKAMNDLSDDGTLAYYDYHHDRVRVRGTKMTPALRVTLVHELTHALQDQHFDLSRLDNDDNDTESQVLRALTEGDATRVEDQYVETMNDVDRDAYEKGQKDSSDDDALGDVPPALVALFAAPYQLGSEFISLVEETDGNRGIDDALRTPPLSDAALIDPFRFLTLDEPRPVAHPRLHRGEKRLDEGEFGAVALYLMLAARLDPHDALRAVDSWDGDAYVNFVRDGRGCVRTSFATKSDGDREVLRQAFSRWGNAIPNGPTKVTSDGTLVTVESCDPGEQARPPGPGASIDSFTLAVGRTEIALAMIKQDVEPPLARCVAGHAVDAYTVEQLTGSDTAAFEGDAFRRQLAAFVAACRG